MLKFGLYNIEQLVNGNDKSILGGRKKVSISLLNQINNLPEKDKYREQIFLELTDDRGAYKRTYKDRFREFDQQALELVKKYSADTKKPFRLHDTGVSNAQTAHDFFLQVSKEYPEIDYLATDYDPYINVIKYKKIIIALSSQGDNLVEITRPPFVFNIQKTESVKFYPLNHLVRLMLQKFVVPGIIDKHRKGLIGTGEKISLFCPEAQALEKSDKRFHLGQYNLLEPGKLPFQLHCFRAMNVLNKTYFSDDQFRIILQNIHDVLLPDGLFILGSNQENDSVVHGGVYQKTGGKFQLQWSSGEGGVIKDLIQDFNAN